MLTNSTNLINLLPGYCYIDVIANGDKFLSINRKNFELQVPHFFLSCKYVTCKVLHVHFTFQVQYFHPQLSIYIFIELDARNFKKEISADSADEHHRHFLFLFRFLIGASE